MKNLLFVSGLTGALLAGCATDAPEAPEAPEAAIGETSQESICGTTDESQFVNHYNQSMWPTWSFVQTHKRTKGALVDGNNASAPINCSGTMVGANLFLTASQCVNASTVGKIVMFDHELLSNGSPSPVYQSPITAVHEANVGGLGYAILQLFTPLGYSPIGVTALAPSDATVGSNVAIMSHPNGGYKMLEAGTVASTTVNELRFADLDTRSQSRGAGIINPSGQLVAVHTTEGCTATGGTNNGVRASRIRSTSTILGGDCVLKWLETQYGVLLQPAGGKGTMVGPKFGGTYVYREYSQTGAITGVNLADQSVYYLQGTDTSKAVYLGSLSTLRINAGCQ